MKRKRYKRRECSDRKRVFLYHVEQEYQLFKMRIQSQLPEDIYNRCNEIRFYECLHEYFVYHDDLNIEFVQVAFMETGILKELWRLYLKLEHLEVSTWEQIEDLFEAYLYQVKGGKNNNQELPDKD